MFRLWSGSIELKARSHYVGTINVARSCFYALDYPFRWSHRITLTWSLCVQSEAVLPAGRHCHSLYDADHDIIRSDYGPPSSTITWPLAEWSCLCIAVYTLRSWDSPCCHRRRALYWMGRAGDRESQKRVRALDITFADCREGNRCGQRANRERCDNDFNGLFWIKKRARARERETGRNRALWRYSQYNRY